MYFCFLCVVATDVVDGDMYFVFQIYRRGSERITDVSWETLKKEVTVAVESEVIYPHMVCFKCPCFISHIIRAQRILKCFLSSVLFWFRMWADVYILTCVNFWGRFVKIVTGSHTVVCVCCLLSPSLYFSPLLGVSLLLQLQSSVTEFEFSQEEYRQLQVEFWSKFYACCLQYQESLSMPLGLTVNHHTGLVCLLKKVRRCDQVFTAFQI